MPENRLRATVLYHYFHPDDVVSARHLSDLAEGLARRGWDVVAMPCNRGCRDEKQTYPAREQWQGIDIRRVWRPRFTQSSNLGRLGNAAWMLLSWSWRAATGSGNSREVLIVGTDPILSVLVAIPWTFFRRRSRVAHWCFDLYPEAAVADGLIREKSIFVRSLKAVLGIAYRRCAMIADLGSCMRGLLAKYGSQAREVTLVPWALVEPQEVAEPDANTRGALFGETRLGLLYSGNFGRAHSYEEFLALARCLRGSGVNFCFAGRGNRADELKRAVTADDTNVSFAGFAPEAELEKRLTACDLHLVSLRPEWTGTVVPSKFFGALAVGRGVLFAGSAESAIARWISEHQVGFVLTTETAENVAAQLRQLAQNPAELLAMRQRCHAVYQNYFSREIQLDQWDAELRRLV